MFHGNPDKHFRKLFIGSKQEKTQSIVVQNCLFKKYSKKSDSFSFLCIWGILWSVGISIYIYFWLIPIKNLKGVVLKLIFTVLRTKTMVVISISLVKNQTFSWIFWLLSFLLLMQSADFTEAKQKHVATLPVG